MDQALKVTVEGNADERGTEEYNLALGQRRATVVEQYLEALGVRAEVQLKTISYGYERPVCTAHNEACYAKNRRAAVEAWPGSGRSGSVSVVFGAPWNTGAPWETTDSAPLEGQPHVAAAQVHFHRAAHAHFERHCALLNHRTAGTPPAAPRRGRHGRAAAPRSSPVFPPQNHRP